MSYSREYFHWLNQRRGVVAASTTSSGNWSTVLTVAVYLLLVMASFCTGRAAGRFASQPTVNRTPLAWGAPSAGPVAIRDGYATAYNRRTRCPDWTAEFIDRKSVAHAVSRGNQSFRKDADIPAEYRASATDFEGSGYDIGHMTPAADADTPTESHDTFLFSNAVPQVPQLNRGPWNHHVEQAVRKFVADRAIDGAWVVTGPLWAPFDLPEQGQPTRDGKPVSLDQSWRIIGPNHVWVPTHVFKSVLWLDAKGSPHVATFTLANNNATNTEVRMVSVDVVEHWSGLDLWPAIADELEVAIESEANSFPDSGSEGLE